MYEHSLILHSIISILSLFVCVVFVWWWYRMGNATTIYKITCFLMMGLFITHINIALMYAMKLAGYDLDDLTTSAIYPCRLYFELLPLVAYAVFIIHRIATTGINHSGDTRK